MSRNLLSPQHPLWLVGFRPFFALAFFSGILMPLVWAFQYSGKIDLKNHFTLVWHIHEMFFGFGSAVLIGFLLTASKNWLKIRGLHGFPLMFLCFIWILERFLFFQIEKMDFIIQVISMNLFIFFSGSYIVGSLLKNRRNDIFRDNFWFFFILLFLLVGKNILLFSPWTSTAVSISTGVFRAAFVVMFERTLTQFMKNTEQVDLFRHKIFDHLLKAVAVISICESLLPEWIGNVILILFTILLSLRWLLWKPSLGFRKFGNGVMYVGFLGMIIHLLLLTLQNAHVWSWGTLSIHTFTLITMGLVIPSMMVRIGKGHTGRKPDFDLANKMAISSILVAGIFRLLMPIVLSERYPLWILLSAIFWSLGYFILSLQIIPFLLKERIDGKVH